MIDLLADSLDGPQPIGVTDELLRNVAAIGADLVAKQARAAQLEQELKDLNKEIFDIETVKLPEAMTSAQMSMFKLVDGAMIKVEPFIQGSIPNKDKQPDKRRAALQWLKDHGHDGIIRRSIGVSLAKGQYEQGTRIRELLELTLKTLGLKKVEVEDEEDVHHMTLKSWAREMAAEGEEFPAETLGLFIGQRAKVELPKS